MKKGLTFLFLLVLSLAAFSQTSTGVEVGLGRGAYSETYKQVGVNFGLNKTYVAKVAVGLDRIDNSKALGVRSIVSAGLGAYVTHEVELFSEFAAAFDRKNGSHVRTLYGATVGGNYHFNQFALGISYNTIPVFDTPNEKNRSPFPVFTAGYTF